MTPLNFQDVSPGDKISLTRKSKNPSVQFHQTTTGIVHSLSVNPNGTPNYIAFRVEPAKLEEYVYIRLDPNLYTVAELLLLIKAAPEPITIQDLKTLPLNSTVSLVFSKSPTRDFSRCILISRTESLSSGWCFIFSQDDHHYSFTEKDIQSLTLIHKEEPKTC